MTITEIENLTFDELKSQKDELIAAARKAPAEELATRYVQARTDAKQRDERMAEMGREITALTEQLAKMEEVTEQGCAAHAASRAEWAATLQEKEREIARLEIKLEEYKAAVVKSVDSGQQPEGQSVLAPATSHS